MKNKILFIWFIFIFLMSINHVLANDKYIVTLNKCVDGDTAYFNLDNKIIKTRFLAIDTPESTNKIEEYGKEASTFTCLSLSNAKKIEIEYDKNSNKTDKYNRDLVWVWVDNILLQEILLKEGLAEIKYLYGDYAYTSHLEEIEKEAKNKKLNIWDTDEDTNNDEIEDDNFEYYIYTIAIILFTLYKILIKNKKIVCK